MHFILIFSTNPHQCFFVFFHFMSSIKTTVAQTLELCDLVLDPFTVKVSRTIGDVIYF